MIECINRNFIVEQLMTDSSRPVNLHAAQLIEGQHKKIEALRSEVTKLAIESAKRDREVAHLEALFEWMKHQAEAKERAAIEARWEKIVKEGVW